MIPIITRWDDVGAPTLNGTLGSWNAVLKHALTTAGWSVVYEDLVNHILVMRNDFITHGGVEAWIRSVDDGSGTNGALEASLQCYENMTGIGTGTGPATALNSGTGVVIRKSETADSSARVWLIAADALRFYGGTYSNAGSLPAPTSVIFSGGYTTTFGAGAPAAAIAGDPCVFVAGREQPAGGSGNGRTYVASGIVDKGKNTVSPTDTGFSLSRDADLNIAPSGASLMRHSVNTTGASAGFGNGEMVDYPPPGFAGHLAAPAFFVGGGTFRGRLPGLWVPVSSCVDVTQLGDTVMPAGVSSPRTLVTITGHAISSNSASSRPGRLFIDTGDWDA